MDDGIEKPLTCHPFHPFHRLDRNHVRSFVVPSFNYYTLPHLNMFIKGQDNMGEHVNITARNWCINMGTAVPERNYESKTKTANGDVRCGDDL